MSGKNVWCAASVVVVGLLLSACGGSAIGPLFPGPAVRSGATQPATPPSPTPTPAPTPPPPPAPPAQVPSPTPITEPETLATCAAAAASTSVSFLYQIRDPYKRNVIQILRLDEASGTICAMDEPPLQLPFDQFTILDERTLWAQINTDGKRELVIYTVDGTNGALKESQRLDITTLSGGLGAFSRDLRFFYTISDQPIDQSSNTQDLHSYERVNGEFVERGKINMGSSYNDLTTNWASIHGLSGDGRWLLVSDVYTFPHGGSLTIRAFPTDATTGAAVDNQWSVWYCCNDDSWASSMRFTRDSRYLVVVDHEYERQRLRTFALAQPKPTEVTDSPITLADDWMIHPQLMEAGPTTYVLRVGEKFSEWKVGDNGSWSELAETTTPASQGKYEASFAFTPSGRVMLQFEYEPPTTAPTIITYLHQGPAKFESKHAYRLEGFIAGIFEAEE